jgi:hypothetical protein
MYARRLVRVLVWTVLACDRRRGESLEAMNLLQKMQILVQLSLALALICPPASRWVVVENYQSLVGSWGQDNERDGTSATKTRLFVMWSHMIKNQNNDQEPTV